MSIKKTPWTQEELNVLKQYYPQEGKDTAKRFKNRTTDAISHKAAQLSLKYTGENVAVVGTSTLTEEEEKVRKFISNVQKTRSVLEIAEHVDKSPSTVDKILKSLTDKHYNVNIREEDQQVSLMKAPITSQKKIISVEDYFGSSREVAFGIVSDLHYASIYSREELIRLMYDIFKHEGITTVFETGNMIDGEIFFNMRELLAYGIEGQVQYFIKHVPKVEGITTHFITGDDHEGWMARKAGINIGAKIQDDMEKVGRYDWKYLSHMESDVEFKTKRGSTVVRLTHPGGGSSYALSYAPQKAIESLQGGCKPHVLIEGHYHKAMYAMIRNVHTLLSGCFEDQSSFMRKRHIEAHIGGWIIRMALAEDGSILKFQPNWYPFFDKKVYDVGKDYPVQGLELNELKKGKPLKVF